MSNPATGGLFSQDSGSQGLLGTTYEITRPPSIKTPAGEESKTLRRLSRWGIQAASRSIMPGERVNNCMRLVKPQRKTVDILSSKGNIHYSGLTVCGSVWLCPICAAKISEKRRVELKKAVSQARCDGYQVLLLTQTIPHYANQQLKPLLSKFQRARVLQRDRSSWKTISRSINLVGTLRSLEVTHGGNGWHIHTHELLFVKSETNINPNALASRILPTWQAACESAGLDLPNQHGVDVRDGTYAEQYVNKWGIEEEMTKSHVKQGREGGRTPWDFLRDYLAFGDCDDAELFREFAKAFKGKRQLTWSRGLRDLLHLGVELSDEELAAKEEEEAQLLGSLSLVQWRFILAKDVRGQVLEEARTKGWPGVVSYLNHLLGSKKGKYHV